MPSVRIPTFTALLIGAVLCVAGTASAAPANPRFAYASSTKANEVLVNWEPLGSYTGTVRYHLYRATAATGPYAEIAVVTGVDTVSYVDTGGATPLDYLRRYWYRIAAEDGTGLNATAQYMSGTPASGTTAEALMSPTTGPPAEPRGLEATAVVDGSAVQRVTLTWQPVSGSNIIRYDVYRAETSGADGVLVGSTSDTTFDDHAGLTVEHHYWYRVSAVAQTGGTIESGPKSFEYHIRPMSNEQLDVPHAGGSPGSDSCLDCHDIHAAASTPLLWLDTGADQRFCLSCHDGTGSKYDIAADFAAEDGSRHPVDAGIHTGGDLICTECHTPHGDPGAEDYKLLQAYGENGTIEYCLVCHEPGTPDPSAYSERTSDMTAFRSSAHNGDGVADPPSGTGIKCRTCHLPHSSPNEDLLAYTGYRACLNCHSYTHGGSLTSPDIYALMTASSSTDAHHDILRRDQIQPGAGRMACQNCHNSHAASPGEPVVDPYDPAPWNPYPASVDPAFALVTNHWENSFCLECHDNTLPSSAETSPWVEPPLWSDKLGDGHATSDFHDITARWGSQNHGKRSTSNESVWPDVTTLYGANPELRCRDCHEPHGTVSIRNLRDDIAGRTGLKVVDMREVNASWSGYDSRFWCMGCHQNAGQTHTSGGKSWATFPKDCSRGGSCHGHQNGAGQF